MYITSTHQIDYFLELIFDLSRSVKRSQGKDIRMADVRENSHKIQRREVMAYSNKSQLFLRIGKFLEIH